MFDKYPISAKQDRLNTLEKSSTAYKNTIKLEWNKKIATNGSSLLWSNQKCKKNINKALCGDFSLDPQGILYRKTRDNDKEFITLIVPVFLLKYVLYERDSSLGTQWHN